MAKVEYVEYGGERHVVDVPEGHSVMEGAVKNGIQGIDAECGGSCSCATCHVYVDGSWIQAVGGPAGFEADLLEFVEARRDNSRLACQIAVDDRLDGLVVYMPATQKA